MATARVKNMSNAKRVVPYRRKREGRTNYKKRLGLLKSGKPRMVIRISNKYIQVQLVQYEPDGDRVLLTLHSKQFAEGRCAKNLPSAYCVGYLFGKAALEKGVNEAIVDIGFQQHRAGTRLYAVVKGAVDAGFTVPVSESVFPTPERLRGDHLPNGAAALFKKANVPLPTRKE